MWAAVFGQTNAMELKEYLVVIFLDQSTSAEEELSALFFTPDGHRLVGCCLHSGTLRHWDLRTGRQFLDQPVGTSCDRVISDRPKQISWCCDRAIISGRETSLRLASDGVLIRSRDLDIGSAEVLETTVEQKFYSGSKQTISVS